MMGVLREWLTSIVVVSMLLSLVQVLVPQGNIRKISSFTGGLILMITLLQPVLGADLSGLELQLEEYQVIIEQRQQELKKVSLEEMEEFIAEKTTAYISDKAEALGMQVTVRVKTELSTDGIPAPSAVEIWGLQNEVLAKYVEKELGIPRERQVWHEGKN